MKQVNVSVPLLFSFAFYAFRIDPRK